MALKLDMRKAYDHRVEWDFICFSMKKGFHSRWVSLVMDCITISSFLFIINGVPIGRVISSRGVAERLPHFTLIIPFLRRCHFCHDFWSQKQEGDIGGLNALKDSLVFLIFSLLMTILFSLEW